MTYTILTLTLVGIVLLFWLYNLMKNCFSQSFCILRNRKSSSIITKDASIISVRTIKKGKKPLPEHFIYGGGLYFFGCFCLLVLPNRFRCPYLKS